MGELMRKMTDSISFEQYINEKIEELQEMILTDPQLKDVGEKMISDWLLRLEKASEKMKRAVYPRFRMDIPMPILPEDK
jgi:hypothetical protein